MGLITLSCPNCNGELKLEDNKNQWFCQYCGSKVVLEEQKIEIKGNVTLDSVSAAKNLIDRGYLFVEDGDFRNAYRYFEKALDLDAKAWKAYIGKLLCDVEVKSIEELKKNKILLTDYENFNKAVRFAPEKEKEYLESIRAEVEERNNKETGEILSEQKKLRKKIEDLNKSIDEIKKQSNINKLECIGAWIVSLVAFVLLCIFVNTATWIVAIWIVTFLGAIVVTVLMTIKRIKNKKEINNNYLQLNELNKSEKELVEIRKQYYKYNSRRN